MKLESFISDANIGKEQLLNWMLYRPEGIMLLLELEKYPKYIVLLLYVTYFCISLREYTFVDETTLLYTKEFLVSNFEPENVFPGR